MLDANNLLEVIKQISVEAVDAKKPAGLLFGKVISASPLKITVEQKMTLTMEQLVLTRNVTDYKVMMTVKHLTEDKGKGGIGEASYEAHKHEYKGTKEFLVHHALKAGEEVLLLRQQGGQKFIVIDRVVK